MSEETKKAPAIRFQGFTDDWEQRKLGDTFEFSVSTNSLSRAQLNYEKGNIKSIHYGDILIKYNSILEITKDKIPFITDGSIEKYKPNLLENGDVVFADAAEDETVGKAVEINGISDEYVVAGLHTIVARPKEKMAKYFSGYYINADVYQRQLLRLMQGTKVSSISKGNLKKTIVAYPKNLAEQQKIGSFFKQLDNAIALHQRKLTLLEQLKQTYLQKLFPQSEKNIPALRFAGFSEHWEQRKLGDTVQITMGQSPNGENYTDNPRDHILVQGNADMKNGRVCPRVWTTQVTKKADPEDIILSVRAPVGDVGRTDYAVVLGRGVAGIKGNAFIFQTLSRMKEQGFWTRYSSGSTFESINSADLKDAFIQICHIEEQTKIGDFFTKLDDTIALHQSKLQKLAELKKTLLAKMLV